jgi:uncharacterized protein YbbC (DUF1343 family)
MWMGGPPAALRAARLGLITHPAAVLPNFTPSVDALRAASYTLTALFGPEHGFGGAVADGVPVTDATDPRTGLPMYSLYGTHKGPSAEALAKVDALVFDLQDVGVRFYTYLSTLFYVLTAAGQAHKPLYVLDRPNPITGVILEGGGVAPGMESFVGVVNLPIRHGMTLGEVAGWMNEVYVLGAELHVVKMEGWRRAQWFDETGLPWVLPSPAMPHLSTAILYPGMCLLEGTPLSLGRGTALPFEVCGAPWLDGAALAEEMHALALPGVRFRPFQFTPWASTHAGQACQGVQVHVTDRHNFRPVEMALHLIGVARRMSVAWAWNPHFERLAGSEAVRPLLEAGTPVRELLSGWAEYRAAFLAQREKFLLYA